MKVTLKDVAELAGVSAATASKAINSRSDIAEETRDKVLAAARSLGYTSPTTAVSLLARPVLNVLFDSLDPYYGVEVLRGLVDEGQKQGIDIVPHIPSAGDHAASVEEWERMHLTDRTIGIIVVVLRVDKIVHDVAKRRGIPIIAIDPYVNGQKTAMTISSTNWQGARDATSALIEAGHTRIGLISGTSDFLPGVDRLHGYRAALADHGIPYRDELNIAGSYTFGSGFDAAEKLVELADPPTAIFALNDRMALGAVRALEGRGIVIPRDMSLVGFDDSPGTELITPALTTVRQPLSSMGRLAVSTIQTLRQGTRLHTNNLQLATTLVDRASVAPPRYTDDQASKLGMPSAWG